MALIADLQAAIMEETIQHRMELEEGTKRLVRSTMYDTHLTTHCYILTLHLYPSLFAFVRPKW